MAKGPLPVNANGSAKGDAGLGPQGAGGVDR